MKFDRDVGLSAWCSFGTGGKAKWFCRAANAEEVSEAIEFASNRCDGAFAVIGAGSNIVISDQGFDGLVILLAGGDVSVGQDGLMVAAGGVVWDDAVSLACHAGFFGLERMSGIPGSVGAAPVQNIAAYGQALSDVFVSAEVVHPSGDVETWGSDRFSFSYRSSSVKTAPRPPVVTSVRLALLDSLALGSGGLYRDIEIALGGTDRESLSPGRLRETTLGVRRQKHLTWVGVDPAARHKNAGSFFVSPFVPMDLAVEVTSAAVGQQRAEEFIGWYSKTDSKPGLVKVSAAHVLLACGFSNGDRWGTVGLSPFHVLALTNFGGATSEELLGVAELIERRAREHLGIELEAEPRIMGDSLVRPETLTRLVSSYIPASGRKPDWVG